ncbi:MAG: penicillin-binding transpeptidase domain-containing protein, partial [Clostridiales bacterium]
AKNAELSGKAGSIVGEFDSLNREIPQADSVFNPPVDGNDLVLTIDENIQFFCERELDKVMAGEHPPKGASVIMMNPKTGEILAMANRPAYDPNERQKYQSSDFRNFLVNDAYEPGSTFKIITSAVALEEDVVTPESRFYDPGYKIVGSAKINCWRSYNPHGSQSFREVMQNSCNPCFVETGLRIEEKEKGLFYKYIKAFGYGQPTGICLSGESAGLMIKEENLLPVNIGTISIGQGISVTPLQMVSAVSAVVNGGTLLKPQLIRQVKDKDGNIVQDFAPQEVRRVISKETSKTVCSMLESVVTEGTAWRAYVPGYRVGGKTGTAQKPGKGGYLPDKYVVSFLGVVPMDDPQLVC